MNARPFENLSVLVIDGNRHMRTLLRGILQAFGARVIHEADDTADALADLGNFSPHVIIVELATMPLDGLEFTRMLRKDRKNPSRWTPVVMLTAHCERRNVEAARDAGINEFMAKPIAAETIKAKLYAAIFRQRRFIDVPAYAGPDRRRRNDPNRKDPERRRE